jgi:N utilization substance protein A
LESESDAVSEADAREEAIERRNDAVDSLVNESQEVSDEGVETDEQERG